MEFLTALVGVALHLDTHLAEFVAQHGAWVYALLFTIVFIETGLVIWPFLPGDSLLFVAGAIAAAGGMDIAAVMATLIAAALTGDNVNYTIGRWIGPRIFHYEKSRWFNPDFLTAQPELVRQAVAVFLANRVPAYANSCRMLGHADERGMD